MSDKRADGLNYAPQGEVKPVVAPGAFKVAAVGLDHGHIFGMCNGLLEAGAEIVWVYDPDPTKVDAFIQRYPGAKPAASEAVVLADPEIKLIACAAVPADRYAVGLRALDAGKDFFVDKPPLTTIEQLGIVKAKVEETGGKYAVYFSERLHVEAAVYAGDLVKQGVIGRVVQVINLAPHRINVPSRPPWFFDKDRYGGILVDIGSHQIEQFLYYSGAKDAKVVSSQVANYNHKQFPKFEDFGDVTLLADNGATMYFRVDWFTPDGLGVWGDGRTFILGTDGYIELRKYIDVARTMESDHVYLVTKDGAQHIECKGKVGFPFFGELILDCLHRTELAQTQEHAFKTIELAILAQNCATRIEGLSDAQYK